MTTRAIANYLDDLSRKRQGSNCSYIEQIRLYVIREKYLYSNLNYLRMQGSIFCGSFWLPEGLDNQVEAILRNVKQAGGGQIQETRVPGTTTPPTYFKLNEFTWVFQEIVNTYGIPRYQEVNPGLFTVTTFPFLFAVMFGDIGHGFLLMLLGIYLCLNNQSMKKGDSLLKAMLPARHMLLMMGFFAFYNGFIYNDYLSLSLDLFGSCYNQDDTKQWLREDGCIYPFGLDPVWSMAGNQLTFQNSYKMKLAVLIAVIHMCFGIILKGVNSVYFRNWIDFFCEFVPQILFMLCTFGLMDFMFIYKWFQDYGQNTQLAPSVITLLIGLVLTPFDPITPALWGPYYALGEIPDVKQTELTLNQICIAIALVCVPMMLLPKPYLLKAKYAAEDLKNQSIVRVSGNGNPSQPLLLAQNHPSDGRISQENDEQFGKDLERAANSSDTHLKESHSEHHDFSEIFVHQVIETIEFVLGSISNTASYLRLWALSLAHGQLAEVFFNMAIAPAVRSGGISGAIQNIIFYTVFALVTFGVLMLMDVMECFLHALRLHWVEFQNKFFKADGYAFVAFSYSKVLNDNAPPKEI